MQTDSTVNFQRPKFSQQMRAVLAIFASDQEFYNVTSPFINFEADSIDWEKMLRLQLYPSHKAACHFAYALWRDELPEGSNPFDAILSAEPNLQKGILKGLATRWGISK